MAVYKTPAWVEDFPVTDGLIFYVPFEESVNAEFSVGSGTGTLDGIKLILHMEEGTGTNVGDDSGLSNDFTFGAGAEAPAWAVDGKFGSTVEFSGDLATGGGAVQTPITRATDDDFDLDNDFSLGAWVNFDTLNVANGIATIFANSNGGDNGWAFWSEYGGNKIRFTSRGGGNIQANTELNTGQWYHLVVTVSPSKEVNIYVDGVSDVTPAVIAITTPATNTIFIGAEKPLNYGLDGKIDEPFFIAGELSADEVAFIAQPTNRWHGASFFSSKFGLGYFAFTGASLSYTANDGNLDKVNGTIDFILNTVWDWDDSADHVIFDTETASGVNQIQIIKNSSNNLDFIIQDSAGNDKTLSFDASALLKNTDIHIAVTWENRVPTGLYIDGDLKDSSPTGSGVGILALDSEMKLGVDATSQANELQATIDEFKIYRRELTVQEILQNSEAQVPLR